MREQRGLTLVELVITIVIISTAVAGVVGAFALISGRSADFLWQTRTAELAQLYLDEIITKRWDENTGLGGSPTVTACNINGPEAGENRDDYDDVDDFDTGGNPVDARDLLDGLDAIYDDYDVAITMSCAGDELGNGLAAADAKRIDLRIIPPAGTGQPITFTAYRANF